MTKAALLNAWLKDVEAVEEHLEAMKLAVWQMPRRVRLDPGNVVRSTAGLLENRVLPGQVYERRLRREWKQATRRRTA